VDGRTTRRDRTTRHRIDAAGGRSNRCGTRGQGGRQAARDRVRGCPAGVPRAASWTLAGSPVTSHLMARLSATPRGAMRRRNLRPLIITTGVLVGVLIVVVGLAAFR